jgi:hypothetical protein
MWTKFYDLHSGGYRKEKFDTCYIEAPEDQAVEIFYEKFGHYPDYVTCTCCGSDYSFYEIDSLEKGMKFETGKNFIISKGDL